MNRSAPSDVGPVARAWWFVVGCGAVGIGAVGIVVPGLPTTVFFIVAAWCFGRSSPRFERWVLELPRIGPLVVDYRAGLGMPARAKVLAVTTMWTAIALSGFALRSRTWLVASVVAAGIVGTLYLVLRVPTRPAGARPDDHAGTAPDRTERAA